MVRIWWRNIWLREEPSVLLFGLGRMDEVI
jgi:hypothetical protein